MTGPAVLLIHDSLCSGRAWAGGCRCNQSQNPPPSFAQNAKEGWGNPAVILRGVGGFPFWEWGRDILVILLDWGWVMRQG